MNSTATAASSRRSHRPANGFRVGDREREKVVTRLGQAFSQGYLSMPEYETRLDQALQAQTAGTLNQLLGDLPVGHIAQRDPRRRAARVAAARRGVWIHVAAYLAASLLMIGIWLTVAVTADAWYFWPVWPILGWGIGVISHAVPVLAGHTADLTRVLASPLDDVLVAGQWNQLIGMSQPWSSVGAVPDAH